MITASEAPPGTLPPETKPPPEKPALADVVVSINGRDEGKYFLVIGTDGDYSIICNGKRRSVEKPKRKKNKHLKLEEGYDGPVAVKLKNGEQVANIEIRRALGEYIATRGDKGGM